MNRACFTRSAYDTMLQEVKPSPVETGGVMVGVPDPAIVVAAGSGGENAVRRATQFTGDMEADRQCLIQARTKYGQQIAIVGHYHKHPYGMSRFSGQDLHQARELVRGFGDGKALLVGIFAEGCPSPEPRLFLYGISHPDDDLRLMDFEIVPDADARIHQALKSAVAVPDVRQAEFWSDDKFRFYENPIGRERIRQELAELRQFDWQLTVTRTQGSKGLRILAEIDTMAFELLLPCEYPLNPPRLFVQGAGELVDVDVLQQWSSDRSLREVLKHGVEIVACRQCRQRHLVPS